jgi:DNA polymerase
MQEENGTGEVYAVDFETYYDKEYGLKLMPTWAYVFDGRFDAYLVSVAGPGGHLWVGPPAEYDWARLEGRVLLHHNASFDGLVLERLRRDGKIPAFAPAATHDTADLAAYLGMPRALKEFAKAIWGEDDLSATGDRVRKAMQGRSVADLLNDPEVARYAANDALLCLRLWEEFGDQWPAHEREVSRLNREAGWRGIAVDRDYTGACVDRMSSIVFEAGRKIPWDWDGRKTPLSRNRVIEHCGQIGIWFPSSFAQDSEECARWEEEFGDVHEWIGALRTWRKAHTLLGKFQHILDYSGDGVYHYAKKYFGASTGRFSGAGGFNMENMPRAELFCDLDDAGKPVEGTGADLRRCFVARPGTALGIVDYAQVEARALVAIVGDDSVLPALRDGMSIYEAHARATMGWTGGKLKSENDGLYRLAKARCLGAGYGAGAAKFVTVAKVMSGLELTLEESQSAIDAFRNSNPKIVRLWQLLDRAIRQAAESKAPVWRLKLHSGRSIPYWKPRFRKNPETGYTETVYEAVRNSPRSCRYLYGAKSVENLCQALCRDVLADAWLRLDRAGYRVLITVHDEFVIELEPGQTLEEAERLILDVPDWAKFLPLAVEGKVSNQYCK